MTPVLRYFKNSYRKKNKHRYSVWTGIPPSTKRYCNVNYVKNNVIFEPPSMRACSSSTPPKQNQDFVKEHNRTPLSSHSKPNMFCKFQKQRSSPLPSYKTLESRPGKFTHTHKTTLNRSICTNSGLHLWNCIGYIWLVLYEITFTLLKSEVKKGLLRCHLCCVSLVLIWCSSGVKWVILLWSV